MATSVFTRNATGLVRDFSWFDAFIISTAVVLPNLYGISSQIAFVSSADPGADFVLSEHLGFLFMIPIAIVYYLLSTGMPRTGGDYIWISRVLHPAVGIMAGWSFLISILSLIGGGGAFIFGAIVVPITLTSFGFQSGNQNLVNLASTIASHPTDIFIVGLALLLISSGISALPSKMFARVMIAFFALIMLGTLIAFVILGTTSHTQFVSDFNNFGGTNVTVNGILSSAQTHGWSFSPVALGPTLVSIPLAVLAYNGFNYSASASGEVKNVRRSMIFGIIVSLIFAWFVLIVGTTLVVNVFGYPFLEASTALGSAWPFAAPAWTGFFISSIIHNSAVLFIVQIGWLLTLVWFIASLLLVSTRYVFALSFDRVLPARLSDVNEKYHTPFKAMAVNIVIAAIFLYLATFTSYIGLLLNSVAIWSIVWFLASLTAVLLPFRRKDLSRGLPGGSWRIPLISIVGVISMVLMAINLYYSFTTPSVGPSTSSADAILGIIFISGLLIYGASYSFLKRKGIDIRLAYSEIPPE